MLIRSPEDGSVGQCSKNMNFKMNINLSEMAAAKPSTSLTPEGVMNFACMVETINDHRAAIEAELESLVDTYLTTGAPTSNAINGLDWIEIVARMTPHAYANGKLTQISLLANCRQQLNLYGVLVSSNVAGLCSIYKHAAAAVENYHDWIAQLQSVAQPTLLNPSPFHSIAWGAHLQCADYVTEMTELLKTPFGFQFQKRPGSIQATCYQSMYDPGLSHSFGRFYIKSYNLGSSTLSHSM